MNNKRCPFCGKEIGQDENICMDCRIKINPHCDEASNQTSTNEVTNNQPIQNNTVDPVQVNQTIQDPIPPVQKQSSSFIDKVLNVIDFFYKPRYIGGRKPSSKLEVGAYFVFYIIGLGLCCLATSILGSIGSINDTPFAFGFKDFCVSMIFAFFLTIVFYVKAFASANSGARTFLIIFFILHVVLIFIN